MTDIDEWINQVHRGDAIELLAGLPSDSVNIVVTSPPYNVGKDYGDYTDDLEDIEYYRFLVEVFESLARVLRPDGRVCWNVPYQMFPESADRPISNWNLSVNALEEAGLQYRDNITWNQNQSDNDTAWGSYKSASSPWLRHQTEAIIVAHNGRWKREAPDDSTITGEDFIRSVVDLWSIPTVNREYGHPAAFPTELPRRCLKLFSYRNDVVLDPFVGSGTTAVAAKQLEREYIGIDLEQEYVETARKRLRNTGSRLASELQVQETLTRQDSLATPDGGLTEAIEDGGGEA